MRFHLFVSFTPYIEEEKMMWKSVFMSRCRKRGEKMQKEKLWCSYSLRLIPVFDTAVTSKNLHPRKIENGCNSVVRYYLSSESFTFLCNFQHFKITIYKITVSRHVLQLWRISYCANHAVSVFENKVLLRVSGQKYGQNQDDNMRYGSSFGAEYFVFQFAI
jgi:hypothetical protein